MEIKTLRKVILFALCAISVNAFSRECWIKSVKFEDGPDAGHILIGVDSVPSLGIRVKPSKIRSQTYWGSFGKIAPADNPVKDGMLQVYDEDEIDIWYEFGGCRIKVSTKPENRGLLLSVPTVEDKRLVMRDVFLPAEITP